MQRRRIGCCSAVVSANNTREHAAPSYQRVVAPSYRLLLLYERTRECTNAHERPVVR